MDSCTYPMAEGTEDTSLCGYEVFYEFTPEVRLCNEHCRETYDKFKALNRQLLWFFDLKKLYNE